MAVAWASGPITASKTQKRRLKGNHSIAECGISPFSPDFRNLHSYGRFLEQRSTAPDSWGAGEIAVA
jgi:hypothetical protein